MIFAQPYHRRRLEYPDGLAPRASRLAPCLACHKGDAKEEQTSVQVGAQTGGVALSSVNINQASPGPIGTGFSNGYPTGPVNGPGGSGGSDNTINFSTDTDMPAAISALDQALTQNQQDNQETAALAQSAIDSASGFSSGLQKIAVICSLVAGGFMGWKYLESRKN